MSRNAKLESIKFLTLDEIAKLLSAISDKRDKAIFLIAYRHGLRASEIGLLQMQDLNFDEQRIYIHRLKGSLSGVHPLQPDESRILKSYLKTQSSQSPTLFVRKAREHFFKLPKF